VTRTCAENPAIVRLGIGQCRSWSASRVGTFDDSIWKSHARAPIILSVFSTYCTSRNKDINNRDDDTSKERRKGQIQHTLKYTARYLVTSTSIPPAFPSSLPSPSPPLFLYPTTTDLGRSIPVSTASRLPPLKAYTDKNFLTSPNGIFGR
jgi:hypothetical protein